MKAIVNVLWMISSLKQPVCYNGIDQCGIQLRRNGIQRAILSVSRIYTIKDLDPSGSVQFEKKFYNDLSNPINI